MKVILFGATGMIGQGVLRECLLAPDVKTVLSVGRRKTGQEHPKLRELVHADFTDFSAVAGELRGYDACFYCLGVSSVGMSEAEYRRVTHDFTVAAAKVLIQQNPGMVMVFVSGLGTDSTETGRTMWARVKGQAENALLQMPFKAVYMFRPAYVHAVHGSTSGSRLSRMFYAMLRPLYPLWQLLFPKYITTTEHFGRAMLQLVRQDFPKRILESRDIDELGRSASV
jgi:uncharacterized protein YbjT (DUF2867 family)